MMGCICRPHRVPPEAARGTARPGDLRSRRPAVHAGPGPASAMTTATDTKKTRGKRHRGSAEVDAGLGNCSVSVAPESVWISKGMGTHYFQIQLQVCIPQVDAAAGR